MVPAPDAEALEKLVDDDLIFQQLCACELAHEGKVDAHLIYIFETSKVEMPNRRVRFRLGPNRQKSRSDYQNLKGCSPRDEASSSVNDSECESDRELLVGETAWS